MGHIWDKQLENGTKIYEAVVSDTEQKQCYPEEKGNKQSESWRHITGHGTERKNSRKSWRYQ